MRDFGVPVENLMSVNGVLLVAVSWEAVEGLAISNELCKPSQDFPDAFRGLDVLFEGLTLHLLHGLGGVAEAATTCSFCPQLLVSLCSCTAANGQVSKMSRLV